MVNEEKLEMTLREFFREVIRKFQIDPSRFVPMISVFFEENGQDHVELFVIDPHLTDSSSAKSAFTQQIKDLVRKKRAHAVTHIINSDYVELPKDSDLAQRIISREISMADALRQGLCTAHEALVCSIESPTSMAMFRQQYTRDDKGAIVLLEYTEKRDPSMRRGRFTGYFDQDKAASSATH